MTTYGNKKVLIFHPAIAPYRIRFFNEIYDHFQTRIFLFYRNLKSQTFDYDKIQTKFHFRPIYAERKINVGHREVYLGEIKQIKNYKPDIVVVSEYGEDLCFSLLRRCFQKDKYKIVTICDDSRDIAEKCTGLRKVVRGIAIKHLDGLILCNEDAARWYEAHSRVPAFVFPIIQDEKDFYEDRTEVIERAERLIQERSLIGKRAFLFVGRLAPEKNIEYLIDSFIAQHERNPENILFIVGGESPKDPSFRERMEMRIADSNAEGYITFVGRCEGAELKAWYRVGQIFVLPSVYEPFGAVVNEALLSGEYVMVSSRAGSSCLVNEDNGEVLDVEKPIIDFSRASMKVPAISGEYEARANKMPFSYREKMDALLSWIGNLVN